MFNRPRVTRRVLERVLEANPQAVYLIADGPRPDHSDDQRLCEEVRKLAHSMEWKCPVVDVFAESNMGLRRRVSSGLDVVFQNEEQAIIVEDDCLADPSFFRYATELLGRFADEARVGIISGNNFLRGKRVTDHSYFFSPDVRIWGWATWRRVWSDFSETGLNYPWTAEEARSITEALQSPSRQNDLVADAAKSHSLNSWALPFVLHSLRRGYVNATPEVNLVTNIGFGAGSTHTKFESFTAEVPAETIAFPLRHPDDVVATPGVGQLQDRVEKMQWVVFPLRHPLDFLGRVSRYLWGVLRAKT